METADLTFTKSLPKIELHAHLTGSISKTTLHQIWQSQKATSNTPLSDPLTAIPTGQGEINVSTFFPIFDKYIYNLIDNLDAIRFATRSVLEDFLDDGVVYVELRTTPRAILAKGMSKEDYVRVVLETMTAFMEETERKMTAYLILSIDRRNTLEEAMEVAELALKYRSAESSSSSRVVGLDLCGNPAHTPITHLAPAFILAHTHSLTLTLHFAEIPASSSDLELSTLLSWHPQRLGHVIHVPPHSPLALQIAEQGLGLELCLSCNVQAGLSEGGYADHHFKYWRHKGCAIALSTDDVGIFESGLSSEYALAGKHFGLDRRELIELSKGAVGVIFGGDEEKVRLNRLFDDFSKILEQR